MIGGPCVAASRYIYEPRRAGLGPSFLCLSLPSLRDRPRRRFHAILDQLEAAGMLEVYTDDDGQDALIAALMGDVET